MATARQVSHIEAAQAEAESRTFLAVPSEGSRLQRVIGRIRARIHGKSGSSCPGEFGESGDNTLQGAHLTRNFLDDGEHDPFDDLELETV